MSAYYDELVEQLEEAVKYRNVLPFLEWEGGITDTPFVPPEAAEELSILWLVADGIVLGFNDFQDFRPLAETALSNGRAESVTGEATDG